MEISRDADGLRFIGYCERKTGFVAGDIRCVRCNRCIDPHVETGDVSLTCSGCGFKARVFWSEAELHVYLTEHWDHLRKACTHPMVTAHGSS
jgi:hypothetical protein